MTHITRFPPSPTGSMHIGNARTALFNWLYARHHGGEFVLRIEDTDKERSTQAAVDVIFKSLEWLGLDWDNDPVVFQTSNAARHVEVANQLLAEGKAYHCYASKEELAQMREEHGGYNGLWRDRDPSEAPEGIAPTVRIKAPQNGQSVIHDEVQGKITIDNNQIDDFILLRSDGSPTYMLSVVVDDHDMGITHILRGNDHLNNAHRQKVIFDAMNWNVPVMAHLPLITGPDGAKYSKRHGAVGVMEFKEMGILPEALFNYLLRLGWGHGDTEIISREDTIELFDLDGVGKSSARFDMDKLLSFNTHYIKERDNQSLLELVEPYIALCAKKTLSDVDKQRLLDCMDELKERAKTLLQISEEAAFLVHDEDYEFEDKAKELLDTEILNTLKNAFIALDDFSGDTVMATAKDVATNLRDGKLGKIGMPLRAALTGRTTSPSIFHAAAILGKDETLRRIDYALSIGN